KNLLHKYNCNKFFYIRVDIYANSNIFVKLNNVRNERWFIMKDIKAAVALIEAGQVDEAHELLQSILQTASDEERFAIVELYEDWGFIEDAIDVLELLLERYPTEGQLLTKLAELYIELQDDERAIQLLNSIGKEDPFYLH